MGVLAHAPAGRAQACSALYFLGTLEHAEEIGLGSRAYTFVDIDG